MTATQAPMEIDSMERALGQILGASRKRPLQILKRTALNEGTFPGEVVRYKLGRGPAATVFCKHGGGSENFAHGHRGGPAYEARVYQLLSRRSQCPLPRFQGFRRRSAYCWLVLEYLEDSARIHKAADADGALVQAATWIGRFHAEQETTGHRAPRRGLNRYDYAYYVGWARRARVFSEVVKEQFPWMDSVCERFETLARELVAAPQTLIHAEFYPKNILLYRGEIRPVDWESAAIAPGEIDLATLTEGWKRQTTMQCEQAYVSARWPAGAPADFARRLALSRMYVHLRWLGDPQWTLKHGSLWYFRELRKMARRVEELQ